MSDIFIRKQEIKAGKTGDLRQWSDDLYSETEADEQGVREIWTEESLHTISLFIEHAADANYILVRGVTLVPTYTGDRKRQFGTITETQCSFIAQAENSLSSSRIRSPALLRFCSRSPARCLPLSERVPLGNDEIDILTLLLGRKATTDNRR